MFFHFVCKVSLDPFAEVVWYAFSVKFLEKAVDSDFVECLFDVDE